MLAPERLRQAFCVSLIWVVLGGISTLVWAEEALVWRTTQSRIDAQIDAWPLKKLLEKLGAATGWQIYVEPKTERTVSAKFNNLAIGEALGRLLGDLNFALLPQTNASPKLFVFRTSVQEAVQLIEPPKTPNTANRIPNELIVTLKPGAKKRIDDMARELGAIVLSRSDDLKSYRLQFEDQDAADYARSVLELDQDVSDIDSNYSVSRPTRIEALSVSSPLPFTLKPRAEPDPNRLIVGLIDTGIQMSDPRMQDFLMASIAIAGEANLPSTYPIHGTSMAETILHGIALTPQPSEGSSVRILPVDVYGNADTTTTFDIAKGIYIAIENGARIINLSLGSEGNSTFMHSIIEQGRSQGVLFIAAAGNEPSITPIYPAAYPEVMAATAGDKRGNVASYANRGQFVDVVAPGINIIHFNNQSYLITGTSASTAYVSGLAAGLAAQSGKSLAEVEAQIRETLAVSDKNRQ